MLIIDKKRYRVKGLRTLRFRRVDQNLQNLERSRSEGVGMHILLFHAKRTPIVIANFYKPFLNTDWN